MFYIPVQQLPRTTALRARKTPALPPGLEPFQSPRSAGQYNHRGIAYQRLKQPGKAIKDFSRAIGEKPGFAAYYNRGNAYFDLRRYRKAVADYGAAIRLDPKRYQPYSNRGYAYEKLRRRASAIGDFRKVLQLSPNHRGAAQGLKRLKARP